MIFHRSRLSRGILAAMVALPAAGSPYALAQAAQPESEFDEVVVTATRRAL